jgi:hypothetical protein
MEKAGSSETLVNICQFTRHHISKVIVFFIVTALKTSILTEYQQWSPLAHIPYTPMATVRYSVAQGGTLIFKRTS